MSQILAVFGATGQQGSSVVNYVLNDPELSQHYKVRAITRDVESDKAKQLREKVEVMQGDVLDRTSLETALTGVHTVFAMTTPTFSPDGLEIEYNSAKTIADVAVEKGVKYIIFSTLSPVSELSGGKYRKVNHFEAKAKAEKYIRSLPIKSAFYSPGYFMENFQAMPFLTPKKAPDGTWVMAWHNSPKARLSVIDAVGNSGNFVGAILAEPDKFEGKTLCAAEATYTLEEIVALMSKTTGKTVVYKQIPVEDFKASLPFPAEVADVFVEVFNFVEEFGNWGADSEKLVARDKKNARGRLTTLEEYFKAHPLQLV
ncbi:MAG: hypothetical protein Q9170_004272 [Blastenia crenularia]